VLAGEAGGQRAEPFERVRTGGPVGDQRLGDWLAGVAGFQLAELAIAGPDDVGGAAQDAATL
jgi:hypothetical protein